MGVLSKPLFFWYLSKKEMQVPRLFNYTEAAAYLSCSARTVWQLVKDGEIPAVKFGTSVRIDRSDLDTFIEQQKRKPQDAVLS
jgi:excisionase family DNA binding protein